MFVTFYTFRGQESKKWRRIRMSKIICSFYQTNCEHESALSKVFIILRGGFVIVSASVLTGSSIVVVTKKKNTLLFSVH